jgi:uroporphyrinogen decarboxylase
MPKLKNDRLLRALLRKPVDVTPVWIMRQAGRYLPEYRQVRQRAGDFMTLCKTPELACEVTLQPINRFPLDAAILFSDILTIPDAMGLGLSLVESKGPRFARTVRSRADIDRLSVPDPETQLRYVMDAIRLIVRELGGRVPLIGFAGSPWTIGTYMIEGGSSKEFNIAKGMLYDDPAALHKLLAVLAESITQYLNAQIAAGVRAVMIFDSWGGALSETAYREFSLAYMQRIVAGLHRQQESQRIPVILFSKGGGLWLDAIAASGCDAIGVDWTIDLARARQQVGDRAALQGNMDPAVLYANAAAIRREAARILAAFGHGSGHVFNLGHGIHPDIDPERVAVLVDAVHESSRQYHGAAGPA